MLLVGGRKCASSLPLPAATAAAAAAAAAATAAAVQGSYIVPSAFTAAIYIYVQRACPLDRTTSGARNWECFRVDPNLLGV